MTILEVKNKDWPNNFKNNKPAIEEKPRYHSCFYVQGEDADKWLDILNSQGIKSLLKQVSDAGVDLEDGEGEGEILCETLTHETHGNFVVTHSPSLSYLGISVKKE